MSERIFLSGASLVLPDRIVAGRTIVIEGGRIIDLSEQPAAAGPNDIRFELPGHFIVPAFIDVHVHGVGGRDSLDSPEALGEIAMSLPRYGIASFCPTSV